MKKKIKISAYAGIAYLVAFLPEMILTILRDYYYVEGVSSTLLKITYVISTISTILFFYGFILVGNAFNNNRLIVGSIIIILTTIFYYMYEWYAIDQYTIEENIVGVSALLLYGFAGIVFGLGLYKIREVLGTLASAAAVLEIIVGFFFVTVILFFIGLILSIPAVILEILLLLKAAELSEFKEYPKPNQEIP